MAGRGFKIADAWVEIHADKDEVRRSVRDLPRSLGPDADRAGQALGDKLTEGLARKVQAASGRIAKARRQEVVAADAVKLAELRLTEAREKGNQKASTMLALEQKLSQANLRLADAQSAVTRSTNDHAKAQQRLAEAMTKVGDDAGRNADRSGKELGGKLAQGIQLSIVRNSPLIAAAIGGALAVGAPVALAGAVALFGGIGVVAAAQSEQVQSVWLGTWQRIKGATIADAQVIEPTLVRMADRVGDSFDRMRPRLQDAFAAAGPQVEVFTDGILELAENALPGLVRSVERGMPATRGFATFLERTGTGLSDFFDRISAKSPEAGAAMAGLGDMMAALLPTLGELLGQGAELAAIVLPMLGTSLEVVLAVVDALGPALPAVVTGLLAMKIAQTVSGWVGGLGEQLGVLAARSGVAAGSAGKVSSALSKVSAAAGPVGVAVGLVAMAMAHGKQQAEDYARAMMEGGAAADQAWGEAIKGGAIEQTAGQIGGLGAILKMFTANTEEASEAQRRLWNAMAPAEQAASKVTYWTNELNQRLQDQSSSTADVEAAKRRLAHWQAEAARLADNEARAIRGVTEAMVEQANQARSRVDASFAYEQSLNGVEDAQTALNEAIKEHGRESEEAERAILALNEAYDQQVEAAGRIATSGLPASMDEQQKAILGAKAELDELNKLIAAGVQLPPSMEAYRRQLEQITGQADGAMLAQAQLAAAVGELGFAVKAVPGEKSITITAPTDALIQKLEELGFKVTHLENGEVKVTALTEEAHGKLGNLSTELTGLSQTVATPTADLNPGPLLANKAQSDAALRQLGGQRPTPVAGLDPNPLLGNKSLADQALRQLGGQRPTPVAGLDPAPFTGFWHRLMGQVGELGRQRPTPTADLNDRASGVAAYITRSILGIPNRNVTVTTTHISRYVDNQVAFRRAGGFTGGRIGSLPSKGLSDGGKVEGPGTTTSDDVGPFASPVGQLWFSTKEWVIKALSAGKYGDRRMAAVNQGIATVLLPQEARTIGLASGGSPGRRIGDVTGAGVGTPLPAARELRGGGGTTIRIDRLEVNLEGTFDFTDRRSMRKAAVLLRAAILDLERADH